MKKKILIFIIGMLVGCIITTIVFSVFGKTTKTPRDRFTMEENGDFEPSENMRKRPEFKNEIPKETVIENTNTVN